MVRFPRSTHPYLQPFYDFIDWLISLVVGTGRTSITGVDLALRTPLPNAPTYSNGTNGVGATLTAGSNVAFPTLHGIVPFLGMFVMVAGQADQTQNGFWQLTTMGSGSAAWVLTRGADWDTSAEMIPGTGFGVRRIVGPLRQAGDTSYAGDVFIYSGKSSPVVGTDNLTFTHAPKRTISRGVIPSSRLAASVNPTANDTIAIGGTTFKFVGALVAAGAQVQVLIGIDAAHTYANMVNAINGDSASAGTAWIEATTPFAKSVVADMVTATVARLMLADARGGVAIPGVSASMALTASISGGASAWENTNLNATGKEPSDALESWGQLAVTTALITGGTSHIELPFAPAIPPLCMAYTSAHVPRWLTDTVQISGSTLVITYGGGGAPNMQNGDTFVFAAHS